MWEAATGKLVWHKLLAPVIGVYGKNAGPAFVAFSGDGQLIVAAGRRDDPVKYSGGIVAVFDATTGRWSARPIRRPSAGRPWHPTAGWSSSRPHTAPGTIRTSSGSRSGQAGRGGPIPPTEERAGFVQLAGMQFQANSSFLEAAMRDGNVIRFNGLTGREQRRFLADGRTPEQQKAGRRRTSRHLHRRVQRRRPHDGLVFRRMGLRVGRRGRYACVAGSATPTRTAASSPCPPTARRSRPRKFRTRGPSVRTRFACTMPRHGEPVLTLEPVDDRAHTCWRSRPMGPSSSPGSSGARHRLGRAPRARAVGTERMRAGCGQVGQPFNQTRAV